MFEKNIIFGEQEFCFSSKHTPKLFEFAQCYDDAEITEYELTVDMGEENQALSIKWSRHMVGLLSYWSPTVKRDRSVIQWFAPRTNTSNLYYGAPIISVINQGDINFSTVAVSEAVKPVRMTFAVNDFEEKENLDFYIYLFEESWGSGPHTIKIRIDDREIPYYETISSVSTWWEQFYPIEREKTVKGELPLYSSWYNVHQNPTQAVLEKDLAEAAKCGFQSMIIDDGWSYAGKGHGDYRDCGNWNVCKEKFPDFKGFVEKLHQLGVASALWFPVPFIGYLSEDYKKFQGKILATSEFYQAGILDPRYPEVRRYITDAYVKIVEENNLDGLKLDFIDSFRCEEDTVLCTDRSPGYDCEEVEEGVICLLREIREALTSRKPDFMIEFRQFYVGPAIVKECNMLRVADCAFDCLTNRVGIVDLRLLNYKLAVHADMLVWSQDESLENVAKMLLNIMFGVPQISVLLQKCNEEQKRVLKYYIEYWKNNKDTILHGRFQAQNPEMCYSVVSAESKDKKVTVAYSEKVVCFEGKTTDIFNATSTGWLCIENASIGCCNAKIYDYFGDKVSESTLEQGIQKVLIPQGGHVLLSEKK
jgi:alpha-galactosidase